MKTYDVIAPIGGCCDAAAQLKLRNLRPASLPFDWIGSKGCEPRILEYLSEEAFADDFAHAFERQNFLPMVEGDDTAAEPVAGVMPYCYQDAHTGWKYIHHFERPISEPGVFEAFAATQKRRLTRFLEMLDRAQSALFLLTTGWAFDPAYADRIHEAILRRYPGKRFDLRVMQFGASEECAESDRCGGGLFRYVRKRNDYDFVGTNIEWRFLDDLRLTDWPPKPHGFDKIVYKLWKPLERYLRRNDFIRSRGWR